ncbi:MAG: ATP-binding protein [Candidatus Competibacteraceae bacterium]|nr:ATP-binding protein [Candidatus Competibacteraceae bacterium]
MASIGNRWTQGSGLLPMLVLSGLLLLALVLMSSATEQSQHIGRLYMGLLLASTAGLLFFLALISRNLYRLWYQHRVRAPGARLTLRLVIMFVLIALAPVTVVYVFSVQFLQRGIDSWFNVRVEKSLEDALELSQTALDLRMREVLRQTDRIADALINIDPRLAALTLGDLLNRSDANELTLFSQNGRIIATASADATLVIPNQPPDAVLLQARQGHTYVGLDPISGLGFHIRAVVRVPARDARREVWILQALFSVTDRFGRLADSVQAAFESYQELLFLRAPLKASFILTLSLALLLGILSALWAAVYSANRLVQPIRDLAEGTQAVAIGQYDKQLPQTSSDELGFLVDSFNQMTRSLAEARDAVDRNQQLLEAQRAYLEVVLERLSSGVLTLEPDGQLRTCNATAGQILGMDLIGFMGAVPSADEGLSPLHLLLEAITPHLSADSDDWRQEVTLFNASGRQILTCRGSSLPDPLGLKGGHVIVFDDVTTLVQAERNAAWTEVARRLAHEIKNPLTPIQLASERIRHKYLKNMTADEASILDRCTQTIIQQVQAMKEMVDAFNQYARPPQLNLTTVALNDFISDVLYMYRDYPAGVEIQLTLDPSQPKIEADKGRLRQLLHNLTKNGIEAIQDGQGSSLQISTRWNREADAKAVELRFQDDGSGFPEQMLGSLFEPYVTTKPKGSGLGLAIVKRIVEEHGGVINAESPPEGGACITIRLPISAVSVDSPATPATITTVTFSNTEEAG